MRNISTLMNGFVFAADAGVEGGPAVAEKPVAKATSKAKAVKKTAKKAAKKESTPRGPSVRFRALKALKGKDMTASQIADAIGLGHGLKPTMDQEVARGHLTTLPNDDSNAVIYHLTAAGRKALEKNEVDPPRTPRSAKPAKKVAKKAKK